MWGYDPKADLQKLLTVEAAARRLPRGAVITLASGALLVALAIADLAEWGWVNALGENQIAVTLIAEAVLIAAVYFVFDAIVAQRDRRVWNRIGCYTVNRMARNAQWVLDAYSNWTREKTSKVAWERYLHNAQIVRDEVDRATPMMATSDELAGLWNGFFEIALRATDVAREDREFPRNAEANESYEKHLVEWQDRLDKLLVKVKDVCPQRSEPKPK
jgi:hypothetical protein